MTINDPRSPFWNLLRRAQVATAVCCLTVPAPTQAQGLEPLEGVRQVQAKEEPARRKSLAELMAMQFAESPRAPAGAKQERGGAAMPGFIPPSAHDTALLDSDIGRGASMFVRCAFQACLR